MRLRKIGGKVIACACLSLSVLMCVPMSEMCIRDRNTSFQEFLVELIEVDICQQW